MNQQSDYQKKFSAREFALGSVRAYRFFTASDSGSLSGSWSKDWVDGENTAFCVPKSWAVEPKEPCDGTDLTTCVCGFYAYWQISRLGMISNYVHLFNSGTAGTTLLRAGYRTLDHLEYLASKPMLRTTSREDLRTELITAGSVLESARAKLGLLDRRYTDRTRLFLAVSEHYGETLIGELGLRSRKSKIVSVAPVFPEGQTYANAVERRYPSATVYGGLHGVFKMLDEHPVANPETDAISVFSSSDAITAARSDVVITEAYTAELRSLMHELEHEITRYRVTQCLNPHTSNGTAPWVNPYTAW